MTQTVQGLQEAANHAPGRFCAVATYSGGSSPGRVGQAVAALMRAAEGLRRGSSCLVAVRWSLLEGLHAIPAPPEVFPPGVASRQADVFVHVSAETEEERINLLRLADGLLAGACKKDEHEEICGLRTVLNQEAFGYRDPARYDPDTLRTRNAALVTTEGSRHAAGYSWLLHQRYVQDVDAFFSLEDENARNAVFGRTPKGETVAGDPTSHGHIVDAAGWGRGRTIVRRGFRYRHRGQEGLQFVALSNTPTLFRDLLRAMHQKGDQLLKYAEAVSGGLYVVPGCADFVRPGASRQPAPQLPASFVVSELPVTLLMDVTQEAEDYMALLREHGFIREKVDAPGEFEFPSDVRQLQRLLHSMLAAGDTQAYEKMEKVAEESELAANKINKYFHGRYRILYG